MDPGRILGVGRMLVPPETVVVRRRRHDVAVAVAIGVEGVHVRRGRAEVGMVLSPTARR
jgi:hypothetical protein